MHFADKTANTVLMMLNWPLSSSNSNPYEPNPVSKENNTANGCLSFEQHVAVMKEPAINRRSVVITTIEYLVVCSRKISGANTTDASGG
jgi:hypothetical protein